jgi:hypothetical protein
MVVLAERQALYPMGTEIATDTIRDVLIQDGHRDELLAQMTDSVLRQKLVAEAALAGYHDLFFMFASLTLLSLIPVLFMRGGEPMRPVQVPVKKEDALEQR